MEVTNVDQLEEKQWVIDSIFEANKTPPPQSTAKIHTISEMIRESTDEYQKFYLPKVVSIGPYHFGEPKLEFVEKLKPVFTLKLLAGNNMLEKLNSLYEKLGAPEMVQELRSFYEENSTSKLSNKEFTKMMLLDSYCGELNSHQIVYLHQDLFLLENQIPFDVLTEVMKLAEINCVDKFKQFICGNILAGKPKKRWLKSILHIGNNQSSKDEQYLELKDADHLLHLLHRTLTENADIPRKDGILQCTFRNVNELMDVGIHFKPSETMSLAHIKYLQGWLWFTADVELPPITVDDSTKPLLLNLIAYETCTRDASKAWVTSYICLLDSLIGHPEDVKALRKAGVLENSLGSDNEVVKLFNEIGTDLVPNSLAYLDAKSKIQKHYKSWSNTLIS
ncbi:hypothetical protein HanPSC8_Chr13g0551411 [Helianthus annuus]|nr:hypothetical protein HanPSC8_Chr13g0551411 [Helianthus annuus]